MREAVIKPYVNTGRSFETKLEHLNDTFKSQDIHGLLHRGNLFAVRYFGSRDSRSPVQLAEILAKYVSFIVLGVNHCFTPVLFSYMAL